MIEIRNLSKTFGSKNVLKNINLDIASNKSFVILGPSGSGKSVLVKIVRGIMEPDEGSSVKIDGIEITKLRQQQKIKLIKNFSFMFQYNALFDSMNVRENLIFAMSSDKTNEQKDIFAKELITSVELDNSVMELYPSSLSGGMQRRVALARALASEPKYIVLDEPITGLDPMTAAKIDYMICKLIRKNNITAITITHSVESTKIMGDEIIFLWDQSIHWRGTRDDFLTTKDNKLVEFMYAYDLQKCQIKK